MTKTAALHPIDLDALDSTSEATLWLCPIALLRGGLAAAAQASGGALALAGGDMAFGAVEILARGANGIVSAQATLPWLTQWGAAGGTARRQRIETQLDRLSRPRSNWAGLTFDRPLVMGIVNATPDSLFAGSDTERAIARGRMMLASAVDIIDIGGESTRPGAAPVSPEDEMARIEPIVRSLAADGAVLSVDTRHAAVMAAALSWGARIVNDISALEGDRDSLRTVARAGAPVVLMHKQGEPQSMQAAPRYSLASLDVIDYLAARIEACVAAGIPAERIVVDPGIGFGKRPEHNLEIMARLALLQALGCGVLIGISRKSTIGRLDGDVPPAERLPGSLAGALAALDRGVQILRVHDVGETRQAVAVWRAIAAAG